MALTYKKAGVDITKGEQFVHAIKPLIKQLNQKSALSTIGGFGGLFPFPVRQYRHPLLVSSTDGVGTKLKLAFLLDIHDTVGIDLVAMNVNDVLVCGAQPLFFLDYIGCGKLSVSQLTQVVKGIIEGCRQAGCMLVGGETAEMPAFYQAGEYDLAGFCVGVVEKKDMVDGTRVRRKDVIIGIASSGLHSNGFSLARKVFSQKELKGNIGKLLLAPTKIYVNAIRALQKKRIPLHAMAHITGGAFYEKLPRMIPKGLCAQIERTSWDVPEIFSLIQQRGKVSDREMYRTFNMGIGMAVIVSASQKDKTQQILKKIGYSSSVIGEIVRGNEPVRLIT